MKPRSSFSVLAVALATLLLQGCATDTSFDNLPRPRGTVPVEINPGADTYTEIGADMVSSSNLIGEEAGNASNSEDATFAKELCDRVGKRAIEYSAIAAAESGGESIARLLEAELLEDNRKTAVIPAEGELSILISCRVKVELTNGDTGEVTLYELLDSEEQVRVRWEDYVPM
jgi:hypothetical protein